MEGNAPKPVNVPGDGSHHGAKVVHIRTKHGTMKVVQQPDMNPHWLLGRRGMYLGFIVILLIVLNAALTRKGVVKEPGPVFVSPPPPTAGPVLGPRAIPLVGLKAVEPPMMPSTARLAPGSAEAQAAQVAFSQASRLPIEVENSIGMRFRLVPPGQYIMGSPADETDRWEGEYQHSMVVRRPFYMSVCEVTQGQWIKIMSFNRSYFRYTAKDVPKIMNSDVLAIAEKEVKDALNRPAEEMTWHEAVDFSQSLAVKESVDGKTYRLPFEAEWEYACRAGTQTAYCFGNDPNDLEHYADYAENAFRYPNLVGQRLPNAFGLRDMHGNVWEWCLDRFACYPLPAGVKLSDEMENYYYRMSECRILRGGNWESKPVDCRSASRKRFGPKSHGNMLGFRLIRTIPEYKESASTPDAAIPDDIPPVVLPQAGTPEVVQPPPPAK